MIVERIRASENATFGFNAATEVFEDLVATGVIDPAKVTRTALQNAASIAGLMLTTEAMMMKKVEIWSAECLVEWGIGNVVRFAILKLGVRIFFPLNPKLKITHPKSKKVLPNGYRRKAFQNRFCPYLLQKNITTEPQSSQRKFGI